MGSDDKQVGSNPALEETAPASFPLAGEQTDVPDSLADDLASMATLLGQVAETPADGDSLRPGPFGGHFEIVRRLGAGGMGVVYLARDLRLSREVAIKIHAVRAGEVGFDRLQREATAMARLSHPNVIGVYEVGTADDRLFIVMEYMSGGTLRDWLKQEHSLGAILDVFAAAGAGLAAAHEAGLVHRDFKPDNVFMAAGGRVCVADFGLARAVGDSQDGAPEPTPEPRAPSSGSLDSKLTATGAAVGTPAYMAPEQHGGRDVDERADQFAFCVALYEAVYGRHPFGGSTMTELRDRALSGEIRAPESGKRAPRWLKRILWRGLSARPGDRFPSMRALMTAISRGRRRLPLMVAGGVASVALLAVAAGTWAVASSTVEEPCTSARDRLAGVWDGPMRGQIESAFGARSETFGRVRVVLDRYADDWTRMRTDNCRATRVEKEQSEQLMDLRVACLERRRSELAAFTRLLADEPGPEVIATSVEAAYKLTDVDQCADTDALLAAYPPPDDEATVEAVSALRARLDQVDALGKTGQYKEALEQAKSVQEAVAKIDYPPLQAESLLLLGQLEKKAADKEAEQTLQAAADAAARARDDRRLAQARVELVRVIGHLGARYEEALALVPWARTSVARIGDDALMESDLIMHKGSVLMAQGNNRQALETYRRALALREEALGADDPRLGVLLRNMSIAYRGLGDLDHARQHAERARQVVAAGYGSQHPEVADALNTLAILSDMSGDSETAVAMFREVLALREATLGAAHPRVASAINNVGIALRKQGRLDDARAEFERALDVWRAALSPEHPNTVVPLHNLGKLAAMQERWSDADRAYGQSVRILSAALGDDSPKLVRPLLGQGQAALGLGDRTRARQLCGRAAALVAQQDGGRRDDEINDCLTRARR